MNGRPNFCSNCGVPLSESETYCFACGAWTGRGTPRVQPYQQKKQSKWGGTALIIAAVLSLMWAMIALTFGFVFYLLESLDALFFELPYMIGKLWLLSGALSVITCITAFSGRYFIVSIVTCIIASIVALPIGAVGFVVVFLLFISRTEFKQKTL